MLSINHFISSEDSFVIEEAMTYLITKYTESGHNQKPVILHSTRVATALMFMGYEKKVIVGALLHDIIEDTDVTEDELASHFGQEILSLVNAVSYNESIIDPIEQYKDMYMRVLTHGREAVVLKAVDIADNSLYIKLVPDAQKRRQLVEKGSYFLEFTEQFSSEPAWQLLKTRNMEEIAKLS